jgi:hypothetical protein
MSKRLGFFYLAHPYTCRHHITHDFIDTGEQANFELANQRAARLFEAGYNIYSPISHTHPIHRASPLFLSRCEHEAWYDLDNEVIDKTQFDGIILSPGWEKSIGCVAEKERFEKRGLKVMTFTEALVRAEVKELEAEEDMNEAAYQADKKDGGGDS